MLSKIMKRAHQLAKKMEGDYTARLSIALRQAWKEAKKVKKANTTIRNLYIGGIEGKNVVLIADMKEHQIILEKNGIKTPGTYQLKEILKQRGYKWNKLQKGWELEGGDREAEKKALAKYYIEKDENELRYWYRCGSCGCQTPSNISCQC